MALNIKQEELNRLAHEARYTYVTARLDLDAFLALDTVERALRWMGWDTDTRIQCVQLAMQRRYGDWDEALIPDAIEHWDAKFSAVLLAANIDSVAARAAATVPSELVLQVLGDGLGLAHDRRTATAYTNAQRHWRRGLRPRALPGQRWLVPSSSGQVAHLVCRADDGQWVCSCAAGRSMHWPLALVQSLDAAILEYVFEG